MNRHLKCLTTSLMAVALAAAVIGCSGPRTADAEPTPPSSVASPGSPSASSTPGSPIKGLPSLPGFPVEVAPDAGWVAGEGGPGSMSFRDGEGSKILTVQAISEVAGVAQQEVPRDVATFLQGKRKDVRVTNQREVTQSGLPAQRFRLEMRNKMLSPSDMWGVGGMGYKPLRNEPMEVVAVRSADGLVWLWTEWNPDDEEETLAAFEAALERVTIR